MKKLTKRVLPLLLAVVVTFGSVIGSFEKVQATGITEVFYYTYWDLISTIYAQCGYSTSVDQDVINNHGVTGKQVWDNFCTSVENTAKFHYGVLNDAKEQALKDLKNLATTATAKGIKLTQELYDMLKDCLIDTSSPYKNNFDTSSSQSICAFIGSVIGYDAYGSSYCTKAIKNGYLLSIIKDGSRYMILYVNPEQRFFVDYRRYNTSDKYPKSYCYNVSSNSYEFYSLGGDAWTVGSDKVYLQTGCGIVQSDDYQILFKNGSFYTDTTVKAAQVSEGACPKEVPEVTPWHKETDIPDGWRVVPQEVPGTGGDQEPDKDPDKEPDKKPKEYPDVLPGTIPLFPFQDPDQKPAEKPDSTEDPATDPDKDPAADPDKEPAKDPGILVNPQTGNLIDPNTGLDIDPQTGKLIDPETGELIDPDNLPDSGGGSGGEGGGLPGAVSSFGDITKLFPFCIPFDLVRLIEGMKAKEAAPKFHYEYHFESINYTFTVDVDLTDYAKYIKIFRFGMQVFYAIALMLLTIKVSKLFI